MALVATMYPADAMITPHATRVGNVKAREGGGNGTGRAGS